MTEAGETSGGEDRFANRQRSRARRRLPHRCTVRPSARCPDLGSEMSCRRAGLGGQRAPAFTRRAPRSSRRAPDTPAVLPRQSAAVPSSRLGAHSPPIAVPIAPLHHRDRLESSSHPAAGGRRHCDPLTRAITGPRAGRAPPSRPARLITSPPLLTALPAHSYQPGPAHLIAGLSCDAGHPRARRHISCAPNIWGRTQVGIPA